MNTFHVAIPVLKWAVARARLKDEDLLKNFPRWHKWLSGEVQPTRRQLKIFANQTRVPFGYLFLPEPPEESLPIPDFRTLSDQGLAQLSPDLIDVLHQMKRRQAWLREDLLACGADSLPFVGSASLKDDPEAIGREMRRTLGLNDDWAAKVPDWTRAVSELRRAIENTGVMAVLNSAVGNNTSRRLDVDEFRGFALVDQYAPLIFVNGADAKSAQMFTWMHELAHMWLGESALSDAGLLPGNAKRVEVWCNQAAAESLVPGAELRAMWPKLKRHAEPFEQIARRFKVSPIVSASRALDLELIGKKGFFAFYKEYTSKEREQSRNRSRGGDFYNTQNNRVGEFFAKCVVRAALEGRTGFREAYQLTGLYAGTFQKYARRLGFNFP